MTWTMGMDCKLFSKRRSQSWQKASTLASARKPVMLLLVTHLFHGARGKVCLGKTLRSFIRGRKPLEKE